MFVLKNTEMLPD